MSNITFAETAFSQYLYWQTQDKRTLKKINRLLQSIDRDGPLNGIGKPEILKYLGGNYSRRIDEQNRLIYTIQRIRSSSKRAKGTTRTKRGDSLGHKKKGRQRDLLCRPFDVSRTHIYHHHRCGVTADPFIDTSIEFYLTKK